MKTVMGVGLSLWMLGCSGLVAGGKTMNESKGERVSGEPRIEVEIVVNASLEDVWHAWTTNEGVQTFFAKDTNIKLEIGGPFEMLFNAESPEGSKGSEGCLFLSYLPLEMLSFSWSAPPQFQHARPHRTWVVLRFEELESHKVLVKLTHLGWREMKAAHPNYSDEWDQVYDYFTKAWPYVLSNLQKRFDEGPRWG